MAHEAAGTSAAGLKGRLRSDDPFACTFCIIPSVEIVELIGQAGFDGVILDLEHGAYGIDQLSSLILAARAAGIYPIVRVSDNQAAQIGAALDAGAAGIIVPQIAHLQDAREAVFGARFHPLGKRGANPWVRAAGFSGLAEHFREANESVAVFVMVECAQTLQDLGKILDIPSLDGVFLGPYDLAQSLGHPGEIDHPDVQRSLSQAIVAARERKISAGIYCKDASSARGWIGQGANLTAIGVDAGHIGAALRQVRSALKAVEPPIGG